MSFASFVSNLSDAVNDGIRAFANSGTPARIVGKTTRLGLNTGKAVGKVGFGLGMKGVNTVLGGANYIKDNYKEIGKAVGKVGKEVISEANEYAQAGAGVLQKMDDWFLNDAPLTKSLIGKSFNKRGLALVATGATIMQGGKDAAKTIQERQGRNDGRLYRPTPTMSTPYMLSEQMAYSQHGRSFADNAGATGDLVFALNNMRHG